MAQEQCQVINLRRRDLQPGTTFEVGAATATFICSWHVPPAEWRMQPGSSKARNAASIVVRLDYAGRSVLFTGDAVGREIDGAADQIIATEKFMVDNAGSVPIAADVLIAPHHGGDNASSAPFIAAVRPKWVIFSAGSVHKHPHRSTAQRYLAAGVRRDRIFRTDWEDDEGGAEWGWGGIPGHNDPSGDDDVDIVIGADGGIGVSYRP